MGFKNRARSCHHCDNVFVVRTYREDKIGFRDCQVPIAVGQRSVGVEPPLRYESVQDCARQGCGRSAPPVKDVVPVSTHGWMFSECI